VQVIGGHGAAVSKTLCPKILDTGAGRMRMAAVTGSSVLCPESAYLLNRQVRRLC